VKSHVKQQFRNGNAARDRAMTEPPLDRPGVVIRIPMRYSPRQSKRPPSPQDHPDAIVCQRARLPTTPEYQVKKLT
jgi:hypothetical protein